MRAPKNPAVSVVIPVRDAAPFLGACLDSVRAQSLRDLEIICVDDGSTDDTPVLLADYSAREKRLTVLTQPPQGAAAARNRGLDHARGDWLLFFDADDVLHPDALARAVGSATTQKADAALLGHALFRDGSPLPPLGGPDSWRTLDTPADTSDIFRLTRGWAWDKLWRRDFILSGAHRFQSLPVANDLLFTYGALAAARRLVVTDAPLVAHRQRAGSVETTRDRAPLAPAEAVRALHARIGCPRGFARWVPDFLFWHVNRLASPADRRALRAEAEAMGRAWGLRATPKWLWEEVKYILYPMRKIGKKI